MQVNFRMPAELKERLEREAKANNRSLTAEIVHRLQETLEMDDYVPHENIHTDKARQVVLSKEEVEALLYEAAAKALSSFKRKP